MATIEIDGLTKRYDETVVVDRISLAVEEGELLVLVGGSGSGKTTTLKMINRLIEPTAGTVRIGGQDVRELAPHVLRRRIGYVFQRIGLFPHMTVADNVGVTLRLLGRSAAEIDQRVDELLTRVELDPAVMRSRFPAELSGGQQQRVGVARALAARPSLMLLDEPFGALDPVTRDRLQQSFVKLRAELRITGIFVTHDMVEALLLGDRVGVMREGRLVQVGTPHELITRPSDEYVTQLMETPMRHARIVDELLEERAP